MRVLVYVSIGALLEAGASGQALIDYSVAAAAAVATATGAKGTSKSVGGVFRNLSETLDKTNVGSAVNIGYALKVEKAATNPAAVTGTSLSNQQSAEPVPESKPVNPSEIKEGLSRTELIERFGIPLMSLASMTNSQLVERMRYKTSTSDQIVIKLIDGKVASIQQPPGKKQEAQN